MSPLENNPSPSSETTEQKKPQGDSQKIPQESSQKIPRKKLSKKAKIALLATGWVLLLGIVVGVALITKPAPEVIYTDAITEAYKFSQQESAKVTDIVDDLDYYGYYTANPLTFSMIEEGKARGAYRISGLKDKTVENKINNRIMQAASTLYDIEPERGGVQMSITASYFNILSCYISQYDYDEAGFRYEYFNFDLNTGEELRFEDLFSANVNYTPLFYKDFYDSLSTTIQFNRLAAERRLAAESYAPDPTKCQAQYCPFPGETYASLRALIAEYDNQMANIEQTTINAIQDYLAGEKKFYLDSSGPTFVLSDETKVQMALKDNIRYAVYLKNYRSANSIYEDDTIAATNLFFTEVPSPYYEYINEETDTYLFSYAESKSSDNSISPALRQAFRDYIKNKGLSAPGDAGKFRYIYASGNISQGERIRTGYISICASEVDKPYYDLVYRKSIIDGEVRKDFMSYIKTGHYDESKVTNVPIRDNSGGDFCSQQKHVAMTASGEVIDDIDGILIDPPGWISWENYLKRDAYTYICNRSWNPICYTEEEKQSHELIYTLVGSSINISLKDNSEYGSTYLHSVDLNNLPIVYINPELLVNPSDADSYL